MYSLHLTHPKWTHTRSSGQPCYSARGAVGGSVPCSRTPQSWYWRRILPPPTIPAGPEIRTHNLPLTSPTHYPLGHDCPNLVAKSASIGRVSFMSHHQVTGLTEDSVDESSLYWFISVWILSVVLLTVVCVLASTAMSSTANRSSRAESFGLFYEQISKEIQKNIKHYKGKCKQVNFLLKLNGEKIGCLYIFLPVLLL